MSDPKKDVSEFNAVPEAEVRSRKRHFSISVVWIVPLVAVLIGGWLVFKALSEKGPVVTILVALVNLGALASIHARPGAIFFCAVVVITLFAAMSFDPRLIWDTEESLNE